MFCRDMEVCTGTAEGEASRFDVSTSRIRSANVQLSANGKQQKDSLGAVGDEGSSHDVATKGVNEDLLGAADDETSCQDVSAA